MAFWSESPDDDLRDIVAKWCYSTDEGLRLPWKVRVEPDGRADLIVAVEAVPASLGERPCRCEVFGIKTHPLEVATDRPTHTIAVQFQPGSLSRLLGVSARELTDRSCDLTSLLAKPDTDWVHRLGATETFSGRQKIIADALRRLRDRTDDRGTDGEIVRAATEHLKRHGGNLPIRELARRLDQHPRRLERLFLRHVGISPKRYARIIRFCHAKRRIAAGQPLASVAASTGYCDQAHLCRDFQALANRTPAAKKPG